MLSTSFKSGKEDYVRSLLKLIITFEGICEVCIRFIFAFPTLIALGKIFRT